MTAVHRVAVLVFDGVKLLDVAGPSEVFAEANRGGANYELVICSVGGHDVDSSTGMRIPVNCDVADSGSLRHVAGHGWRRVPVDAGESGTA